MFTIHIQTPFHYDNADVCKKCEELLGVRNSTLPADTLEEAATRYVPAYLLDSHSVAAIESQIAGGLRVSRRTFCEDCFDAEQG